MQICSTYLLFVCTVQTVVGEATCSVQCILHDTNSVPTARGTAADWISTSNNNYFGYCRVVILFYLPNIVCHFMQIFQISLCVGAHTFYFEALQAILRFGSPHLQHCRQYYVSAHRTSSRFSLARRNASHPAGTRFTSRRRCNGESEGAAPWCFLSDHHW
jgi:hypothetical protein